MVPAEFPPPDPCSVTVSPDGETVPFDSFLSIAEHAITEWEDDTILKRVS